MVKDNSANNLSLDLGTLSVSVDELLQVIESKRPEKVRATSGDYEFEGLDDIKANPALLSGYPTIYCDGTRIEMSKFSRGVRSGFSNADNSVLTRSIHAELVRRKGFVENFIESKIFSNYVLFPWFIINSLFLAFRDDIDISENKKNWIGAFLFGYICLAMIKLVVDFLWRFYRPAVRYTPKDGFLSRHFESIVVSSISGLIGIFVGALGSRLVALMGLG